MSYAESTNGRSSSNTRVCVLFPRMGFSLAWAFMQLCSQEMKAGYLVVSSLDPHQITAAFKRRKGDDALMIPRLKMCSLCFLLSALR